MTEGPYHRPVLLRESVDALAVRPEGVYVDATFGGGGHSRAILERLGPNGLLFGFDQDEDAAKNVPDDDRFELVKANFRDLKRYLKFYGYKQVDGILADLGVSSHQLDEAERGFSYRFAADLDMRMDRGASPTTAASILNTYTATDLQRVLGEYGEVRNARTLANALVDARALVPFRKSEDLNRLLDTLSMGNKTRYFSQVYQALRIEANDEMGALEALFAAALDVLPEGGRLVVISYHSLEDRMTKHFMKSGNVLGEPEKDFYGNISRPFKLLTKGAVLPSDLETKENPRARSAKMRVAERI